MFSDDDQFAFLLGEWVACNSSAIRRARYDPQAHMLWLEWKSGKATPVEKVDHATASEFGQAVSKGRWWADYKARLKSSF